MLGEPREGGAGEGSAEQGEPGGALDLDHHVVARPHLHLGRCRRTACRGSATVLRVDLQVREHHLLVVVRPAHKIVGRTSAGLQMMKTKKKKKKTKEKE